MTVVLKYVNWCTLSLIYNELSDTFSQEIMEKLPTC